MKDTKCQKIVHPIAKEFQLKKVTLHHSPGEDFFRSQWQEQTSSIIYLIYRWIIAVFFFSAVVATMVMLFMDGKYFIYLTHWGLMLCGFTSIYGAVLVSLWHFYPDYSASINIDKGESVNKEITIPWSLRIYWALHSTTLNVAIVVTIVYWVFLFPMAPPSTEGEERLDQHTGINIVEHLLNSVFMVTDLMVVAFPTRILHIIFPMLFGIVYVLFSLFYYLAGGTNKFGDPWIYPILDWSKPGPAVGTIVGVVVIFLFTSLATFGLYKLRSLIYRKCNKSKINLEMYSVQ